MKPNFKTKFFLAFFLCSILLNAQNNKSISKEFNAVPVTNTKHTSLNANFEKYSLFKFDTESIERYIQLNKNNEMLFNFVFPGIENFDITLRESDILSSEYKLIVASESGKTIVNKKKQIAFEGNITNQPNSLVRLTITKDIIYGIIRTNNKNYFIEPLKYLTKDVSKNMFVLYETKDVVSNSSGKCGVKDVKKEVKKIAKNNSQQDLGDCYRVEVALASDTSAVDYFGGDAGAIEIFNIALMNTTAPFFKDFEFPTNIELVLTGQYISTTVATDPYSMDCVSCDFNDQLNYFGAWAINGGFGSINYDLAHNITNNFPTNSANNPGNTQGLAWIAAVGDQVENHAVSNLQIGLFTWQNFIHQLGHNFGMTHTQSSSGDPSGIMFGDGNADVNNPTWDPTYTEVEFEAEVSSAANSPVSSIHIPIVTCSSIGPAVADFELEELICAGNSYQIVNTSQGDATSYSWTFSGGTPNTSTDVNPSVIFATLGETTISLTATNVNGFTTITKDVLVINGADSSPCIPSAVVEGNDGGSVFFRLNTISKLSDGVLSDNGYYFDYSCSDNTILEEGTTYTANARDKFNSSSFPALYQLYIDYNDNGDFTDANELIYSGANQNFSFTTPSTAAVKNKTLRARLIVKVFDVTVDPCWIPFFGNGQVEDYGVYFLDNSVLNTHENSELEFVLYPNPSDDKSFSINTSNIIENAEVNVYNFLGQLVHVSYLEPKTTNRIVLNNSLSSGVYFVKVRQGDKESVKKLLIQ
jgi:PKD repeat protein